MYKQGNWSSGSLCMMFLIAVKVFIKYEWFQHQFCWVRSRGRNRSPHKPPQAGASQPLFPLRGQVIDMTGGAREDLRRSIIRESPCQCSPLQPHSPPPRAHRHCAAVAGVKGWEKRSGETSSMCEAPDHPPPGRALARGGRSQPGCWKITQQQQNSQH